ncbi:MAG: SDR family NAD(P)-dependent oxidoreductase [Candidatus Omnitrophota bacterium]
MRKTALITGASSGLGLDLARIFAEKGHDLILIARRQERLKEIKQELLLKNKLNVEILVKDLSQPGASFEIAQELKSTGVTVDVLVNNAGFGSFGEFVVSDFSQIHKMMQVNVITAMELCHVFIPEMKKRKSGHILNVASMAAFLPGPLEAEYFASKACMLSFSRSLAYELRNSGVCVSSFCPGRFRSEFQERAFDGSYSQARYRQMPLASELVRTAYNGMKKRRTLIIPGLSNRVLYHLHPIIPRSWLNHIVYWSLLNDVG